MNAVIQGFILGISYVAPIGAQNSYVINSATRIENRKIPFFLIVLLAFDIGLALVCFFGVGTFLKLVPELKNILQFLGGLYVVKLGYELVKTKSVLESNQKNNHFTFKNIFFSLFALTWLNPQAVIDGMLVIGASKASLQPDDYNNFIIGFSSASLFWFLTIFFLFFYASKKMKPGVITRINILCGLGMIFFGLKLVVGLFL